MQAEPRFAPLATPSVPQDLLTDPWLWGACTGALAQALPLQVSPQAELAFLPRYQALLSELRRSRCSQVAPAERTLPLLSCHCAAVSHHEHAVPPAALRGPPRRAGPSLLLPSLHGHQQSVMHTTAKG